MKYIYGPPDLDSVADMSELSVHFAAYDRDALNMSFSTNGLQVSVDFTDILRYRKNENNESDYYRTATVRLMATDSFGKKYTRCIAFAVTFWFNEFHMVTGVTYLPATTELWTDDNRNTPENILVATDSIYRIILLLLFAGSDFKLADLLGVSVYREDNFLLDDGWTHGRDSTYGHKPWFLEDWTEDL